MTARRAPRERPSFSIIVPTYDRPDRLRECLRSLAKLRYPGGTFEVVVVDDGSASRDAVAEIVETYRDRIVVRDLVQEHRGPASARNLGARASTGRYLAFTDDDCRPEAHWLETLADHFEAAPATVAGGWTVNGLRENICAEASQALVSYLYDYYGRKGTPFIASNNLALSRDLFDALGGFDESFPLAAGEDRELCDRALTRGIELVYVPRARVRHYHALSFGGFVRQHLNYGRGAYHFHRIRATRGDDPVQVEPLRFYVDLVLFPLRHLRDRGRLRATASMVVSQVANAAGFFHEKLRHLGFPLRRPGDRPLETPLGQESERGE